MKLPVIAGMGCLLALLAFGASNAQVSSTRTSIGAVSSEDKAKQAVPLVKPDIDAWLDGFVPNALSGGDVAGAVVVVVKDGQVLTEKAYGYADVDARSKVDPLTTEFRLGSVSKLFTWTAAMQQVEAGRLDLDKDINAYLDYKIPARDGKPVTLRNLMTHTAGFEEHAKRLFVSDQRKLQPLGTYLRDWVPDRVYAPGEVPAYSNYGASLAGYLVQRTSGQPFEDFVEKSIFGPLGMRHSSFRQPIPSELQPFLAKGYARASDAAKPPEWVNAFPAGSMTSTGDDVAHFMIAELEGGRFGSAQILSSSAITAMHTPQNMPARPFEGMALGFFPTNWNGHPVVGHDGDTKYFHDVIYLLTKDRVGLFVAMNSAGADGAAGRIRESLFHLFMDRYYPALARLTPPIPIATARAHGNEISGDYQGSRSGYSSFMAIASLLKQSTVSSDADGTVEVDGLEMPGGATETWKETAPYFWTNSTGQGHMSAVIQDGQIVGLATDVDTTSMLIRKPWWGSRLWNFRLFFCSLSIFGVYVLLWPIQALIRRHYGVSRKLTGTHRNLYILARVTAIVDLAAMCSYHELEGRLSNVSHLDDNLNGLIYLSQFLAALGVLGTTLIACNMVVTWRKPLSGRPARTSSVLLFLASAAFAWLAIHFNLIGTGTQF